MWDILFFFMVLSLSGQLFELSSLHIRVLSFPRASTVCRDMLIGHEADLGKAGDTFLHAAWSLQSGPMASGLGFTRLPFLTGTPPLGPASGDSGHAAPGRAGLITRGE